MNSQGSSARENLALTSRLFLAVPALFKGYRANKKEYSRQALEKGFSAAAPVAALIPDLGRVPEPDLSPWREGEKTPVVCVHGTVGAPGNWEIVAPRVGDRRLYFARYGFQGTGPLEDSVEELAAYLKDLAAQVQMPSVCLLAHSRGAVVSLLAASRKDVQEAVKIEKIIALGGNFTGVPRWTILPPAEFGAIADQLRGKEPEDEPSADKQPKDQAATSHEPENTSSDDQAAPKNSPIPEALSSLPAKASAAAKEKAKSVFYTATLKIADKTVGSAGIDQFNDSPGLIELLKSVDRSLHVVSIASTSDKIVPPDYAFTVPVDNLTTILMQEKFPGIKVLHNMLPRDHRVISIIKENLPD